MSAFALASLLESRFVFGFGAIHQVGNRLAAGFEAQSRLESHSNLTKRAGVCPFAMVAPSRFDSQPIPNARVLPVYKTQEML